MGIRYPSLIVGLLLLLSSHIIQAKQQETILIVGDSISAAYGMDINQGWVTLLAAKLKREYAGRYRVINASISGNTSGDGLGRLPKLLTEYQPSLVIIELGGNDGLRGYPVKLMQKNLQRMIDLSQQSQAQVLLAGIEIPPNYGKRYTSAFRNSYKKIADNNDILFLPFILEGIGTERDLMQSDGIHPKAEAQAKILELVWTVLQPTLKQ